MLASLSVLLPLDREITHFPLDHPWIAPIPTFRVDLTADLEQQHSIVIITV